MRSTGIVALGKAALSIMSAHRTSSAVGAASSPKRAAPTSAMSFVADVYVPSWNMRRWPSSSLLGGPGLVGLAVAGRCEGAHVVIEVPVELGRRAEAKVEDGVDVAGEDPRVHPVLTGAVARAVIEERGAVARPQVAVEAREHDGGAEPVEAVSVRGDDDLRR